MIILKAMNRTWIQLDHIYDEAILYLWVDKNGNTMESYGM